MLECVHRPSFFSPLNRQVEAARWLGQLQGQQLVLVEQVEEGILLEQEEEGIQHYVVHHQQEV